jgi:hypothetical protein
LLLCIEGWTKADTDRYRRKSAIGVMI